VSENSNAFLQVGVLLKRSILSFWGEPKKIILSLLSPVVITLIVVFFCSSKSVGVLYEDTRFVVFIAIIACIYMGMFNSLSLVCKERSIIRREFITGMSLSAYIFATMLSQMIIVGLQSAIFCSGYWLLLPLSFSQSSSLTIPVFISFYITVFLTMLAADAMGLVVSAIAPTAEIANIVAPVIIVLQTALSGVLFPLEGLKEIVSYGSVSKWGMDGVGSTLDLLVLSRRTSTYLDGLIVKYFPELNGFNETEELIYAHNNRHILQCWMVLIILVFIFCTLGSVILRSVRRDRR